MKTKNQNHGTMTFECRACKAQVAAVELADWPFCCVRCQSKNAGKIINAQAEAIEFWKKTSEPGAATARRDSPRQRWSDSIERQLRKLNL